MGPRNPANRGGRNPRSPRRKSPLDRRKVSPTDLRARTRRKSFGTSRSAGQSYVLKLRRLLPLDDSSITTIHRWFAGLVKRNSQYRLAYASAELRTLGPLYGSQSMDLGEDWQSQWVNTPVVPKEYRWAKRLTKALMFKLEEIELRKDTGQSKPVIWMNKIRLVLFNVKEPE